MWHAEDQSSTTRSKCSKQGMSNGKGKNTNTEQQTEDYAETQIVSICLGSRPAINIVQQQYQ